MRFEKINKGIIIIAVVFVMAAAAVIVLFNCMYTVSERERAVVIQFGKAVDVKEAGLHFKAPFIQNIERVDMVTNGMEFGYTSHSTQDGAYTDVVESEAYMITKDFNFVNVDFYVEWRVTDPIKYKFNSENPLELLRNILQSEARSVVSGYTVDEVLTTAKPEIQAKVKEGVLNKLEEYDLGLIVSNLQIQDTEPPTEEVVIAFKNVENAKQNKETEVNNARTYYNEELPKARAEADKIIKDAEAARDARINEATGQVARFDEMYKEYSRNKEITKTRMYLEAMEEILPGIKVYIDDGSVDTLRILSENGGY